MDEYNSYAEKLTQRDATEPLRRAAEALEASTSGDSYVVAAQLRQLLADLSAALER